MKFWLLALMAVTAWDASAGGSNYGLAPGTRAISGKISEWPVPTPKHPRDPDLGLDGNVYFAVREGDKVGRFDPRSLQFRQWDVREGMRPTGLRVAPDGKVIFTGIENGTIGELDPVTGRIREFKTTSPTSRPYTLILDSDGSSVWFTERGAGNVVKLERSSGKVTAYAVGSGPYGASLDMQGNVWVSRMHADALVKLDPRTGKILELSLGTGSQPRRTAVAPDGALWVALYGIGKLVKVDPAATKVVKEYKMPGGSNGGPYAVNVDGSGRVWVSEIQTDNVVLLDPRTDAIRVFKLPSRNSGIRKAMIDAAGRYWYVASHIGRLGVIE